MFPGVVQVQAIACWLLEGGWAGALGQEQLVSTVRGRNEVTRVGVF